MPKFDPIKRKVLIYYLKELGFEGPFSGGKQEFREKDELRLTLPNPHPAEIGRALLSALLREAKIERSEWEKL